MRIETKRSSVRGRSAGFVGLLVIVAPLVAGCQLDIPDGWFPDIPTLPDTSLDSSSDSGLPTTGADEQGDESTTGAADETTGEPPAPTTGEAASTGDEPADGCTDTGEAPTGTSTGEAPMDPSTGEAPGVCGDGQIDPGEVCDDGINDGAYGGCMQCAAPGPFCGDGVVNGSEACDEGAPVDGRCTSACTRPMCGDGVVQAGEQCDGGISGAGGCEALGYSGGALACQDECMYDVSGCTGCGNGVVEEGELCDDGPSHEVVCPESGVFVACNHTCDGFQSTRCTVCGDGVLDAGELCDGEALGDLDCGSFGFAGGALGCVSTCNRLDTTACEGSSASACCEPGPAGACDDLDVQVCVCLANPDCCALEWSAACVTIAVLGCSASCT